ncbi:hypothetical protein ACFYUY_04635 [Kitasatospora sp. NPDC004745]|uniref:hypothetical protein n=1 Tax=Kitasatospora sp. NPDC004745 TaxID=3364019 RepID=UPI0036CE4502
MTLIQPPLMVTGGTHPARALRMMVRDLSRGSQGVTEGGDLKVRSTTTPGPGVRVGNGSAIIRGATWGQGSYTQYNSGDHLVPIAPTGAVGRTDFVCLRVEDPEYEGSRNPATEDIGYVHVIPGVPANQSAPPPGMTAIPLARVTLPPNCQTVTDAMITDLRQVANPRRERRIRTIGGFGYAPIEGQVGAWQDNWPSGAKVTFDVPSWATQASVVTSLHGLRISGSIFAGFRQVIAGAIGNEAQMDTDSVSGWSRADISMVDTFWWTSEQRGTTQTLAVQAAWYAPPNGSIDVNGNTTMHTDVDFVEGVY